MAGRAWNEPSWFRFWGVSPRSGTADTSIASLPPDGQDCTQNRSFGSSVIQSHLQLLAEWFPWQLALVLSVSDTMRIAGMRNSLCAMALEAYGMSRQMN